ncbi:MAG: RIP metalloprotease RseP [Flavobacteriales bacterium]
MDTLIQIAQFILSISILVILHELGHFIPAKLFKTKVEKFYLFFDAKFSLFKKKIGDTEYGIGWIPFGGYVKIAGMVDESMDTEQLKKEPEDWEFRSKPAWQRLIIMAGGVIVNVIVVYIIQVGMLTAWGKQETRLDSMKDGLWIRSEMLKNDIGLQTGDKIVSINNEKTTYLRESYMNILLGNSIQIEREGKEMSLNIPIDVINKLKNNKSEGPLYTPRIPFVVAKVMDSLHNANSGLEAGDQVIKLNGKPTNFVDQMLVALNEHKSQTVEALVLRQGEPLNLTVNVSPKGTLGVLRQGFSYASLEEQGGLTIDKVDYAFGDAVWAGFGETKTAFVDYFKQFKRIINPETKAYKSVGGLIKMVEIFPSSWDWRYFWNITAMLSTMLAVLNILPIPALDGGHIVFLLYEIVSGRKPSQRVLETAQMLGIMILLSLLVLANGNDILEKILG